MCNLVNLITVDVRKCSLNLDWSCFTSYIYQFILVFVCMSTLILFCIFIIFFSFVLALSLWFSKTQPMLK